MHILASTGITSVKLWVKAVGASEWFLTADYSVFLATITQPQLVRQSMAEHPCWMTFMQHVWNALGYATFARWKLFRASFLIFAAELMSASDTSWCSCMGLQISTLFLQCVLIKALMVFPVWERSGTYDFFSWVLRVIPLSCLQNWYSVPQKSMVVIPHVGSSQWVNTSVVVLKEPIW